jgi:DNA polymerase kappa
VDALVEEWQRTRDRTRYLVHIDMDAFYAAVEMRDDPSLVGKPMAVGGISMLSTANYGKLLSIDSLPEVLYLLEARKYGVRSAMPGFIARELCPSLIIVEPNFEKYRQVSEQVQQVLRRFDPNVEMMSLDEGYLDITDNVVDSGKSCEEIVEVSFMVDISVMMKREKRMRSEIQEVTQLTASAGIASNRMLAKICSDKNKPNGINCGGGIMLNISFRI